MPTPALDTSFARHIGRAARYVSAVVKNLLLFVVPIVAFVYCGLSGSFWWRIENQTLDRIVRLGAFIFAVAMAAVFAHSWSRRHGSSVRSEDKKGEDVHPEFASLTPFQILERMRDADMAISSSGKPLSAGLVRTRGHVTLARHVLHPQLFRKKVLEELTLKAHQRLHVITVEWDPGAYLETNGAYLVPIMRLPKESKMRELEVVGGTVLSSLETASLVSSGLEKLLFLGASNVQAKSDLAALIAWQGSSGANGRARQWLQYSRPNKKELIQALVPYIRRARRFVDRFGEIDTAQVLDAIAVNRIFVVAYPKSEYASPPWQTVFSYRSSHDDPLWGPYYDKWRRRKDVFRSRLRLPPRWIPILLERAYSASSYRLQVACDESLYVDEAEVWDQKQNSWLRALERSGTYCSYLGWEEPAGKSFTSLAAARLAPLKDRSRLYLYVRVVEKPPGSLAVAVSVSFATAMSLWLVGSIQGGDPKSDLIAFLLAGPAVAASAFGLLGASAPHGYRSITGLTAIGSDLLLLLLGITLYLRQVVQEPKVSPPKLSTDRYFYFLNDWLWIALFSTSALVLVFTAGTFLHRLMKYRLLSGGSR